MEVFFICFLCEQGCPSTLGGAPGAAASAPQAAEHLRKLVFTERRLKARIIGPAGSVVRGIEKNIGCRIRLEDNSDGSFTAVITARSEKKAKKGASEVNSLVRRIEEDWKSLGSRDLPVSGTTAGNGIEARRNHPQPLKQQPNTSQSYQSQYQGKVNENTAVRWDE